MKKIIFILTLISVLSACKEFQPVIYTGRYPSPAPVKPADMKANTTIKELKALSPQGNPVNIQNNIVIAGQVISTDQTGNIYKSLYIQDSTSAIEVKMGTTGLYNTYKLGQWVYIKCSGLTIGEQNGSYQLGFESSDSKYPIAYIQDPQLIASHIFLGKIAKPVQAITITPYNYMDESNMGKYVSISNLTYDKQIFAILYSLPHNDNARVFLSEDRNNQGKYGNFGIDTWALSKQSLIDHVNNGDFDKILSDKAESMGTDIATLKQNIIKNASPVAVSQYFKLGDKGMIQVRTSGYARFANDSIPSEILKQNKSYVLSLKGILTKYVSASGKNTSYQLLLLNNDTSSVVVNKIVKVNIGISIDKPSNK